MGFLAFPQRSYLSWRGRFIVPASVYSEEALALFAQMSVAPSEARKAVIDALIVSLKNTGIWTKLDVLYLFAAHDAQAARLNWIEPAGSFNATAVNSPTFTVDRGYAGDGATSYLNSNFNPTAAAGQYALDSAHIGVWSRTSGVRLEAEFGAELSADNDSTTFYINADGNLYFNMNQDGFDSTTAPVATGHFVGRRSGAAATALFRNAVSVFTTTRASTVMPNFTFYIDGQNRNNVLTHPSNRELAAVHAGANLTDSDITDFYAALNTYMVAVGAA